MGCGASHVPDKPMANRMVLSHDGVKTIFRQVSPVLAAEPGAVLPVREPMTSPTEQPDVELAPEPQPQYEPEPEPQPQYEPEPEPQPQYEPERYDSEFVPELEPEPQPELDMMRQTELVLASEPSTPPTSSIHRPALLYAGAASVGGSFLAPLPSFGARSADDGARRNPGINTAGLANARRHSDGWQPAWSGLWAGGADALSTVTAAATSRSRQRAGPRRPPSAGIRKRPSSRSSSRGSDYGAYTDDESGDGVRSRRGSFSSLPDSALDMEARRLSVASMPGGNETTWRVEKHQKEVQAVQDVVDRALESDPPMLGEETAERVMAALYKPDALQATLLTAWRCNCHQDDRKLVRRLLLALPPGPTAQRPVSIQADSLSDSRLDTDRQIAQAPASVHGVKHPDVSPPAAAQPVQARLDSVDASGESRTESTAQHEGGTSNILESPPPQPPEPRPGPGPGLAPTPEPESKTKQEPGAETETQSEAEAEAEAETETEQEPQAEGSIGGTAE